MSATSGICAAVGIAVLVIAAGVSCAQLFDDPIQCHTDADCVHFAAFCDVAAGVCVSGGASAPDSAAPPSSSSTAAPGSDAAVPVEAGSGLPGDPCLVSPKPTATVGATTVGSGDGEVAASTTLGCDKDWLLDGRVFVRAGATLTIAPGTTIRAKKGVSARLVVSTGAKLFAQATRNAPIVFTSDDPAPSPGDWDGVLVLGQAPPEGLPPLDGDNALAFSGANPADASGSLAFVRIEYGKRGLVLAGVGNGTSIDSVEAWNTSDDCFNFSGGTVNMKHLVCQHPGDEELEIGPGFTGHAQFLFGQKSPVISTQQAANGLLIDGARPVIVNATFCGNAPAAGGDGLVFRNGATVDVTNAIFTGWTAGLDAIGVLPAPGALRRSILFGNTNNPAFVEDDTVTDPTSPLFNDDNDFDEIAWWNTPGRLNSVADPRLVAPFAGAAPKPWPATSLVTNAGTPQADGFFDPTATYIGAFKDASDTWMTGAWVRFAE